MSDNTIYGPEWAVICPRCGDATEGFEVDEDNTVTTSLRESRHNVTFATRTNAVVCGDDWRSDTGCGAKLKVTVEVVEEP